MARRMMTVDQAAADVGQSPRTVRRWIANSDPNTVARDRMRLPDDRGRFVLKLVVDVIALRAYGDTQRPGRPATPSAPPV